MSDKFEKATGLCLESWAEAIISAAGSPLESLSHQELAKTAVNLGASEWWGQSIAAELERLIGRREVGQTCSGTFATNASKTIPGEWTEVFHAAEQWLGTNIEKLPLPLANEPTTSATAKWRYWRATFTDGTTVTLMSTDGTSAKPGSLTKTKLSLQHEKLADATARDTAKAAWKAILAELSQSLAG